MSTKCLCTVSLLFVFLLRGIFSASASDFYVSPQGNDNNDGSKLKPFFSIERAQKAVLDNLNEDCTIYLTDGIFEIKEPIIFDESFSGNANSKITIKAENEANPIISGGKLINGWSKNKDGLWESRVEMNKAPRELFINSKRATRARFPNAAYLRVKKVGKDRRTHFFFAKNDFPYPEKLKNVELVLLHDWSMSRIGIKEIDTKKKRLTAVDSIGVKALDFFNLDHWEKNPRYFLENDLAFLDADYEWYFDSAKQKMYLKLPDNQSPESMKIVVPVSEGLLKIEGKEDELVTNVHFEGITFRHSAWQKPEMGYCGVQACYHDSRPERGWNDVVSAAVKVEWAENCSFENCRFENLGTTGLWLATGSKSCAVLNSDFYDISANGIMIGEGRDRFIDGEVWWKKAPEQVALGNRIENCTVAKAGAQFYGAIGIWCGFTAETIIKNNEIYDLPYTGISIGWEWSPIPTPCRANVIDGNHIHNILKILSDGGGIYMLGLQPDSKLVNNHIHDVKINAGRAESNGMFLDEGTTDVVVANNLIYNIAKSPLRFHKATTNLVKENYLFCSDGNPHIRYNSTEEKDIKKVGNKVFSEKDANYNEELKKVIENWK